MSYTNGFVDMYITFVILSVIVGITALILQCIPEHIMDKVWQKLQLDNNEPYDEIDED